MVSWARLESTVDSSLSTSVRTGAEHRAESSGQARIGALAWTRPSHPQPANAGGTVVASAVAPARTGSVAAPNARPVRRAAAVATTLPFAAAATLRAAPRKPDITLKSYEQRLPRVYQSGE